MPGRAHDRSHFFKYASFQTAMRVIESKRFRWSPPTKFNDPFDHQVGFVLGSNPNEFTKLFAASLERVIFSDIAPTIRPDSPFGARILQLHSIRERLPREKLLQMLHESAIDLLQGCAEA
jgi:hypothetical protein